MMYGWMGPYGWISMIIGLVITLAILGGLVWLVVWAVRRSGTGGYTGGAPSAMSAKEIAQQRYARGEITREQYQQLMDDLNR